MYRNPLQRKLDILWGHSHNREMLLAFDSRVREHREAKGLSQEALAREVGVSRQTIMNVERGINEPKVLRAISIAAVLGIAVADLFRRK